MRRLLLLIAAVAFASCVRHAARIPAKAAIDLGCSETELQVIELGGGDRGQHLVKGCGKKGTYELNPLGDWVLTAPVTVDAKIVVPPTAP